MKNLIRALTIFAKYQNRKWPTCCEHDRLYIVGITLDEVSEEDRAELEDLGFIYSEDDECWISFRYGSA